MDGGGFEPPKQFAADLQSVPFGHSGIHPYGIVFHKADDRTRTDNLLITNQLLCQLSHIGIWLSSWFVISCSAYNWLVSRQLSRNESHRHKKWKLQGSNLWPSACKADALPAELRSHALLVVSIKSHYKRPRRDSNPWPPPWQGGALTNWATRPY